MSSTITGKVCAKHPELAGQRYRANHNCTKCHAEYVRQKRASAPATKGMKVKGAVCKLHPKLEGLRYASSRCCVACNASSRK